MNNEIISLLTKGLNFIPTPSTDPPFSTFSSCINDLTRKIKWAAFFNFKNNTSVLPFSSTAKSFPNERKISTDILQWCNDIEQLPSSTHTAEIFNQHNLTSVDRQTIQKLKKDTSLIIKKADKGGKIVLQHRNFYRQEALRQLHNSYFYKQLDTPIFHQTAKIIKRIINNLLYQGFITKSQHRFLLPPENPRPRHFYILPKIHKNTKDWTIPHLIPPGRPIVSGCNSESASSEQFIDFFLNPLASSNPSYLRDSIHLKALLSNIEIQDTDILFTLDVESLYTNIPIPDGIECIKQALTNNPQKNRPDKYILQLLEITLTRNDFQFDNQTFLQIKGTAMGKKYAPSFANIFMHFWEELALHSHHQTPIFWKRYIDDIFGIWTHSEEELLTFIDHINSLNSNIKTSLTFHKTSVDFLDCTIFKLNNQLATKIYRKPTDSLRLLHPFSFHPPHTYKGIIKAQILRYIKLSTLPQDFQQTYNTLKTSLISMGYTRNIIRQCKKEAFQLSAPSPTNMITGCKPCNRPRCQTCKHMRTTHTVCGNQPGDMFLITQNTSCYTHNCIYAIHCNLCPNTPTLYIGETQNSCRERISKHKSDILHNNNKPVSSHFNLPNHTVNNFQVTVIQYFTPNNAISKTNHLRKTHEIKWIQKLHTHTPVGLNINTELHTTDIHFTLNYSKSATLLAKRIKSQLSTCQQLDSHINIVPAFSKNRNLCSILAPNKF